MVCLDLILSFFLGGERRYSEIQPAMLFNIILRIVQLTLKQYEGEIPTQSKIDKKNFWFSKNLTTNSLLLTRSLTNNIKLISTYFVSYMQ